MKTRDVGDGPPEGNGAQLHKLRATNLPDALVDASRSITLYSRTPLQAVGGRLARTKPHGRNRRRREPAAIGSA